METAQRIRRAVKGELGLSVSVGISSNKLLAKMACDLAKPDGFSELALGDVPKIIWPLPVGKLYGIGPQTREKLYRIGIMTIGQLARFSRAELIKIIGGAAGVMLHQRANGVDHREIQVERRVKSIGEETTFPQDVYEQDTILTTLLELAGQVGHRLRREGLVARTVTVKIRFSDFRTITRSQSVHGAVAGGEAICRVVQELFLAHCGQPPWRLVGVQVANLDSWEQLSLFEEKDERLGKVVDQLRDKYGPDIVKRASLIPSAEKAKGNARRILGPCP
ncbi:MAG: DNA polymerase IV [Candidatus Syntrophopropionicum ammoniitolerans]